MSDGGVADESERRRRQRAAGLHSDTAEELSSLLDELDVVSGNPDFQALRQAGVCAPNFVWREKVTQWCYDVVDHLGESRDIVYIAMNILDRFCVSQGLRGKEIVANKDYETSALTATFLAMRISGSAELDATDLVGMSRQRIGVQDIVTIGTTMTETLSWDCRILTPLHFVKVFFSLLDDSVELEVKRTMFDSASYLVELSVCDAFFSGRSSAMVGLASVMNALTQVSHARFSRSARAAIHIQLLTACDVEAHNPELSSLQSRLHQIFLQTEGNQEACLHIIPDAAASVHEPRIAVSDCSSSSSVSSNTAMSSETPVISHLRGHKRPISPSAVMGKSSKQARSPCF